MFQIRYNLKQFYDFFANITSCRIGIILYYRLIFFKKLSKGYEIEKLEELLRNINFTHVYFKNKSLSFLEKYKNLFANYTETNLSSDSPKKEHGNIIFLEFPTLSKESFKILNIFVKHNIHKEIYIFTNEQDNILLLKFVIHFSLNKLYPLNIKEKEIESILLSGSKKHLIKTEEKRELEISRTLNHTFPILILKEKTLIFANQKSRKLFKLNSLSKIDFYIKENDEFLSFVESDDNRCELIIEDENDQEWEYLLFKENSPNKNKIITMVPVNRVDNTVFSISDRFEFLEDLKDKLAQYSVSNTPISLILINISNYEKLKKTSTSIELHEFVKNFINKLLQIKKPEQKLTQWDTHLFILVSVDEEETVKNDLSSIHQKLVYENEKSSIHPVISSSWLNIKDLELDDIIKSIEQISSRTFDNESFNSDDFFELNHLENFVDEREQIRYYLQSCIGNKTVIKLLNIYKGLCINTKSKVLKIKNDSYFVHCESLQGYSMQFDDKTVIQAPDLPQDIEADVVYVNIDKSYAVLENLKFLKTSANNRQHTRVQPSLRTPIMIKYGKYSYQGDIMDISTNAIAIKFNRIMDEKILNKDVELKFKLPDDDEENGFVYMEIEGKITYIGELDTNKSKVVVMLNLVRPYDSYLLKYMYQRQKELILELKKAVKLNSK